MRIIVFHTNHSDDYYDASTNEALLRACASVIKERYEEGWYSEDDEEWSDIELLVSASTMTEALNFNHTWANSKGEICTTPLALHIAELRRDWEYEGYNIEDVEEPTW